jgi:hypothetical protein
MKYFIFAILNILLVQSSYARFVCEVPNGQYTVRGDIAGSSMIEDMHVLVGGEVFKTYRYRELPRVEFCKGTEACDKIGADVKFDFDAKPRLVLYMKMPIEVGFRKA